jgi:hypothetical protein
MGPAPASSALQEGPSLQCPDLEALQVRGQARLDRGATADRKVCGTCTREARLDHALGKDSRAPVGRTARTERRSGL